MRRYLVLVAMLAAGQAQAADAKRDIKDLMATVASEVIAPKFAALNKAFASQSETWAKGCGDAGSLRAAFGSAYDAWANVEFFKSGALAKQTRAERIDYWPDPRNSIDKGLKALLSAQSAADITPAKVAEESVAVQGLPALERILYTGDAPAAVIDDKACAAGQAITQNLAAIARTLDTEWSDSEIGGVARMKALDDAKAREAAVALLTDLATGIRIIEDKKLAPLFGAKASPPNPHAAKSWRSGRSERDIAENIASLVSAFEVIKTFAPDAAASVVEKLQDARAALAATDDPNRPIALLAAINNAKYYAIDVLPAEIGVTLGFNSLDGD